ncbi:tetratricopeptide repeat protein, partial [Patescibacteria group bacterium]
LMIKSVSDFGKDKHDPEVKPWRRYACHAAAAFAFNLIKSGPARSLSEVTASEQTANDEEDRKRAAERRWQYIQNHLLRGIEITFILKGYVGFDWFREVLMDTCLTFSRNDKSFKVGRLLADSASPNTVEHSRASDVPLCSFWEIYEPEPGYWFRKISPTKRDFTVVAGFDAIAPWTTLGIERVKNLEDLALLTEIGISIPARAYQVGVEEFILRFLGDTFSFSVQLTENTPLEALHEFARMQYTITTKDEPMPVGTSFSGVQLLDMFLRQLLPRPKSEKSKTGMGMMGLSGPDGKAISFYPTMPLGFNKRPESHEYSFTITTPAKFDSAARIKELENKLVSNPTDAELYFELASGYSYEGRLLDVIKCLENAIKAAPPSAKVHVLLGQTFRKLGRFDESLLHCEKALTLAPDDARMHNALGVCLAELDKHDAAMVHYETAAQIDPSQSSYQINHSMALVHLHRYSEAIAPAKRAVDLAPDDARCAILLGILFDSEGRRAEATHYFEIATQLAPDSAEAHEHLGTQLARANQHDKAIVCFQRAVEIEDSVRRCELLGASLSSLDRWSEAEEVFRRGVKLDPKHSGMLMNLGVAVATLGRAEEAIDFFKRSLEIDPNNVTAQRNLKQFRKIMEKLEKKGIART